MKMTSLAIGNNGEKEKKLRPLFTEGTGKKKEQGKSLWSDKGIKYFERSEQKWKKIYRSETVINMVTTLLWQKIQQKLCNQ